MDFLVKAKKVALFRKGKARRGNRMDFIKKSLKIDDFVQNLIHQKWYFLLHLRKYPKRSKSATIFQFFYNLFSQAK